MPYDVEQEVIEKKQKASPKEKLSKIEIIYNRILRTLVKPDGFDHVEVKDVGNGCHRVNVITKTWVEGSFFPQFARPISWYENEKGERID
jgi:hypothetical protein